MKCFPKMVKVRQVFDDCRITDIVSEVRTALGDINLKRILTPGSRVAVAVGSRGITNLQTVVATLVGELKSAGTTPFIVPAMGSHGGATADGQRHVLEQYGITESNIGAPIQSSMAVVQKGRTPEGIPVYLDRYADGADHIVVVNCIKPHTDFEAPVESGLLKMIAVGLGKQEGAQSFHRVAVDQGYYATIIAIARQVLDSCPVSFGLGLVENQSKQTAIVQAIMAERLEAVEPLLLEKAKRLLPHIPFKEIDLLIVDRIGKDISGTGMDQNVIARTVSRYSNVPAIPHIKRIFVRDLSEKTDGNAVGIGNADVTLRQLVEKIDLQKTAINCIAGCAPELARIPLCYRNDREAIEAALECIGSIAPVKAKIVHIHDTSYLQELEISEELLATIDERQQLVIDGKPSPMMFDSNDNLKALC